jgi:hypothetical protein
MYTFIPEASFVGTAFVNVAANMLVTQAQDVTIHLTTSNGASVVSTSGAADVLINSPGPSSGTTMMLGSVQYGQARSVLVRVGHSPQQSASGAIKVELVHTDSRGQLHVAAPFDLTPYVASTDDAAAGMAVEHERLRLDFCETITRALETVVPRRLDAFGASRVTNEQRELEHAQASIADLARRVRTSLPFRGAHAPTVALLEDIEGQVTIAFSKVEYLQRWGQHYLPGLVRAHALQQCNNFKDIGIQHYGGALFRALRDQADALFVSMPPPQPSLVAPTGRTAGSISMASYHNRNNPCIAGHCKVAMADGTHTRVDALQRGDRVLSADVHGQAVVATVRCVVASDCAPGTALVQLSSGLLVTPWHPVRLSPSSPWQFPSDVPHVNAPTSSRTSQTVFSVLFDHVPAAPNGVSLLVHGTECAVLGHGVTTPDSILPHAFYGTRQVESALSKFPGWSTGRVKLPSHAIVRHPTTQHVIDFQVSPQRL